MLTTSSASPSAASGKVYRFVDPRRRGDLSQCRSRDWNMVTKGGFERTEESSNIQNVYLYISGDYIVQIYCVEQSVRRVTNLLGVGEYQGMIATDLQTDAAPPVVKEERTSKVLW